MELGRTKQRILGALNLFDRATTEQLSRYLSYSYDHTRRHCTELTRDKYVKPLLPPKQQQFGSSPYLFVLTGKGRSYWEKHGEPIKKRFRPAEKDTRAGLHTIAVNEFLLSAILFSAGGTSNYAFGL